MGKWFVQLASGDLGKSYHSNMQVTKLISQRIEPTLLLAATTIILTILVAIPLGTLAAYKAGSWVDKFVMIFSVAGFSIPVFVLGYILVYIFAMELRWLPVQGYRSPFDDSFFTVCETYNNACCYFKCYIYCSDIANDASFSCGGS